jgi:hypothetical protein
MYDVLGMEHLESSDWAWRDSSETESVARLLKYIVVVVFFGWSSEEVVHLSNREFF